MFSLIQKVESKDDDIEVIEVKDVKDIASENKEQAKDAEPVETNSKDGEVMVLQRNVGL